MSGGFFGGGSYSPPPLSPLPPSQAAIKAQQDRITQAEDLTRIPRGSQATILSQPNMFSTFNTKKILLGQ